MTGYRYKFGVLTVALLLAPSSASAQTRVACVGDSITYGYTLGNRDQEAYPAVLADLLGAAFDVRNYGVSGTTLQNAGDQPWREQEVYSRSLAFEPHIVVIMLGTNDAKPQNWSETRFVADYQALIAEFRALGAEVYLTTPPPVVPPGAFEIQPDVVNETLVALVRQLSVDEEAPLIDVHASLEQRPELLPDTVHPNAAGARIIAETVADALLTSDPTSTSTQSAATSGTSTSTGDTGSTSASSTAGLTTSSAGPTTGAGGMSSATAVSSTAAGTGGATSASATSSGPTSSSQASSSQASSSQASSSQASSAQTASVTSGRTTGLDGAPATSSSEANDAGCACNLGGATRGSWLWCLVVLGLLRRRG
ncbi:MAG TPA: GDSL-type esterase/lipase family protein [Polyangiaceae bacterium]